MENNKGFYYESPQLEVLKIEIEQAVLEGSGNTGEDGIWAPGQM